MSTTETTLCECPCRQPTAGGRFLPGHDSKLKSHLIREALADSTEAERELRRRGWGKFLDRKRELVTLTPEQLKEQYEQRAKERAKAAVDLLDRFRQASKLLQEQGRYRRIDPGYVLITEDNVDLIIKGEI